MKHLEEFIEKIILASRWLLVIFYIGLTIALAIYAYAFLAKLWDFALRIQEINSTNTILKMLDMIDSALIASLVVMVIIAGYENFVSRFDKAEDSVHWLGTIDAGSLKVKVASTIIAISSIHLLQIFLNLNQYDWVHLAFYTILHLTFVVSALFLALIDKIGAKKKPHEKQDMSL